MDTEKIKVSNKTDEELLAYLSDHEQKAFGDFWILTVRATAKTDRLFRASLKRYLRIGDGRTDQIINALIRLEWVAPNPELENMYTPKID